MTRRQRSALIAALLLGVSTLSAACTETRQTGGDPLVTVAEAPAPTATPEQLAELAALSSQFGTAVTAGDLCGAIEVFVAPQPVTEPAPEVVDFYARLSAGVDELEPAVPDVLADDWTVLSDTLGEVATAMAHSGGDRNEAAVKAATTSQGFESSRRAIELWSRGNCPGEAAAGAGF